MRAHRSLGRTGGFTLIELMIGVTMMSIVSGSILVATQSTVEAYKTASKVIELEDRGRHTMQQIKRLLLNTSMALISPTPASPASTDTLNFQRAVGTSGLVTLWGDPERLEFQIDPGETNDGIDNDGDSLVDEGRLVWTQGLGTSNVRSVVLCTNIREYAEGETQAAGDENGNGLLNESGISFDFDGDNLNITLCVEQFDATGYQITKSFLSSIDIRN